MEFTAITEHYDEIYDKTYYMFHCTRHINPFRIVTFGELVEASYYPPDFKIAQDILLRKWFYFKCIFQPKDVAQYIFCLMLENKKCADLCERYYDLVIPKSRYGDGEEKES